MNNIFSILFLMAFSCAGQEKNQYQKFQEDYNKFEALCQKLCAPYPGHIVGRAMPGRLSSDSKCLCASDPPRFAAKWK